VEAEKTLKRLLHPSTLGPAAGLQEQLNGERARHRSRAVRRVGRR
jgi:hypothetical protein